MPTAAFSKVPRNRPSFSRSRLLGPLALGDLALELAGRAHGQGLRRGRHQGDDRADRRDRGGQLDQAGQPVRGPVEQDHFHQVGGAAEDDEGPEQPEDPREGHIPPAADEVDQDDGDGEIRKPDQPVGDVVEQDQFGRPVAADSPRDEPGRVEQPREEIHGTLPCGRGSGPLSVAAMRTLPSWAARAIKLCTFAGDATHRGGPSPVDSGRPGSDDRHPHLARDWPSPHLDHAATTRIACRTHWRIRRSLAGLPGEAGSAAIAIRRRPSGDHRADQRAVGSTVSRADG